MVSRSPLPSVQEGGEWRIDAIACGVPPRTVQNASSAAIPRARESAAELEPPSTPRNEESRGCGVRFVLLIVLMLRVRFLLLLLTLTLTPVRKSGLTPEPRTLTAAEGPARPRRRPW